MLQQPDGLVYGLAGGQMSSHVTREARGQSLAAARVLRLVREGILPRGAWRRGSVQAPQLMLLLLLLREDSLLLGDESWLVVTQRGGGWGDIL